MSRKGFLGEDTANRLLSRNGSGLHRRSMPDGGEVVTGGLADRAIRALGARAFTMDRTIFVGREFDVGNPEHAALYAHEKLHQRMSGGSDEHHGVDTEERMARNVESMVLHRAEGGEDVRSVLGDVNSGQLQTQAGGAGAAGGGQAHDPDAQKALVSSALIGGDRDRDPMEGYKAMMAEGKAHQLIVKELADHVLQQLDRLNEEHVHRTADRDFLE